MAYNAHPADRLVRSGHLTREMAASLQQLAVIAAARATGPTIESVLSHRIQPVDSFHEPELEAGAAGAAGPRFDRWVEELGHHRELILAMIEGSSSWVALARQHGVHYRTARKRLQAALAAWAAPARGNSAPNRGTDANGH